MKAAIARLAAKDIWFHRTKVIWLVVFLSLAYFAAFISLSFKGSIQSFVYDQARSTLSADLSLSSLSPQDESTQRRLTEILKPVAIATTIDFRSMISTSHESMLCEIRAIDSLYPLKGSIKRNPKGLDLSSGKVAYVYPEVLNQLKLKIGDFIKIGKEEFEIESIIEDDPGATTRIFSFTPRIYVHQSFIKNTGLITPGSQIFHRSFYELSQPVKEEALSQIETEFREKFFISTPEDSLDVLKRFFGVFETTIYLLSLAVILMSLFVAFSLFQNFLRGRLAYLATLKVFGVSNHFLMVYFVIQISILSILSIVLAWIAAPQAINLGERWIQQQGLASFEWTLSNSQVLMALMSSLLLSILFVLPARMDINKRHISELFNASSNDERGQIELSWQSMLPLFFVVFALTIWLTQNFVLSVGVLLILLIMTVCALALQIGSVKALLRFSPDGPFHLAVVNLSKRRFSVVLSFVAISFVSFIVQTIPHIEKSLEAQLRTTQSADLPSLFVFNVPEEEIANLATFFSQNGADARYSSPMIPARLMKVNGDEPRESRLKRFPVRLSYRDKLLSSERVIQTTQPEPGVASLSLEKDFADRSNLKLGDRLQFDILGVTVEGKATSIREVDWLKFHPAFFIQFEPGYLEDAPKTLVTSVYSKNPSEVENLLLQTIARFPTVSVLDIRRTLDRVLGIIQEMAFSLQMASLLSLSMVVLTFLGLLGFSLWSRRYEAAVMTALGGQRSIVSRVFIYEYLLLALLGGMIGFFFSAVAAFALIWGFFDFSVRLSWLTAVATLLGLVVLCVILADRLARNLVLRGLR